MEVDGVGMRAPRAMRDSGSEFMTVGPRRRKLAWIELEFATVDHCSTILHPLDNGWAAVWIDGSVSNMKKESIVQQEIERQSGRARERKERSQKVVGWCY